MLLLELHLPTSCLLPPTSYLYHTSSLLPPTSHYNYNCFIFPGRVGKQTFLPSSVGRTTDGINQVETTKYNAAMLPKKFPLQFWKSCSRQQPPCHNIPPHPPERQHKNEKKKLQQVLVVRVVLLFGYLVWLHFLHIAPLDACGTNQSIEFLYPFFLLSLFFCSVSCIVWV